MSCCNFDCRQGRDCPARLTTYKKEFDHLGNPIDQTPPWTAPDLLIVLLSVLCIVGLFSGVFQ